MGKVVVDSDGLIPEVLKACQLFSTWSDEARANLAEAADLRGYAKGETVADIDVEPQDVLVLVRGALFNEIIGANGKRLLFAIVRPGWALQIAPVWEGGDAPTAYTARSDSIVMHIPRDVFLDVANSDIQHVRDVATFACRVFRGGLLRINLSANASLRFQVASMLIFNTLGEFMAVLGVEASPTAQAWRVGQTDVTQDELASMIGYSRQKVNSVMKAMEEEGILRRHGRLTEITNYLLLAKVLDEEGSLNDLWRELAEGWQKQLEASNV